ncbi:hypothetical protein MA16_Dca000010 [Dendrobium catenatum]|uniref:Uncharacterized protein n=1 Tax=Dendrobium catenatum TaxID=906689 RepID=A0A2I0WSQ0_9ASPA|nr:hypothetical protein MA16_Dca000010 [Dendrobium catenatum]
MSCRRYRALLFVTFVVFVIVVASTQNATAIRTMSEELRERNKDPSVEQSVYEKAKEIMASWMEKLPSGPSPGGGGGHHR